MATEGMHRFDSYHPPGRGAVDRILNSADKIAAQKTAIDELRRLHHRSTYTGSCDHCGPQARMWPCMTIAVLERHGL